MRIRPVRTRPAIRLARSGSAAHTAPASPYTVSLAIRTASSSSSKGMMTTTGPKISSWAIRMLLSPEKTVGRTKYPLSRPSGASGPPVRSRAPSAIPARM
jgi:hypothetical protein